MKIDVETNFVGFSQQLTASSRAPFAVAAFGQNNSFGLVSSTPESCAG
jgi:hypothetical protein